MFAQLKAVVEKLRVAQLRSRLRPGRTLSRFVARDVKRDILVVANEEVRDGFVTVRVRTNNILYVTNRLVEEQSFGPPQRMAIANLWKWGGKSWGGLPDGSSIVDHGAPGGCDQDDGN